MPWELFLGGRSFFALMGHQRRAVILAYKSPRTHIGSRGEGGMYALARRRGGGEFGKHCLLLGREEREVERAKGSSLAIALFFFARRHCKFDPILLLNLNSPAKKREREERRRDSLLPPSFPFASLPHHHLQFFLLLGWLLQHCLLLLLSPFSFPSNIDSSLSLPSSPNWSFCSSLKKKEKNPTLLHKTNAKRVSQFVRSRRKVYRQKNQNNSHNISCSQKPNETHWKTSQPACFLD